MTTSSRSRVRRYVFDLDGTLFETKELVIESYRRAGILMPEDAWGKSVHEWLPQRVGRQWKTIHEWKNTHYIKLLRMNPPARSSAASAMIDLALSGVECYILTGASTEAAKELLSGFQPYHYSLVGTHCDLEAKTTRVKNLGQPGNTVYVDDDAYACDYFHNIIGTQVVRYNIDTTTKEEVMEPWVQSSLQRDAESA
jgi:hypothetical protein